MVKIRIGKDIRIKWRVTIAQRPITPDDDLTLVLVDTYGKHEVMPFEVEEGVSIATFWGTDQRALGRYRLEMWLNYGKKGQAPVDRSAVFELVRSSELEGGIDDNIAEGTVEVDDSFINIGVPGEDGKINGYNKVTIEGDAVKQEANVITIDSYDKEAIDKKMKAFVTYPGKVVTDANVAEEGFCRTDDKTENLPQGLESEGRYGVLQTWWQNEDGTGFQLFVNVDGSGNNKMYFRILKHTAVTAIASYSEWVEVMDSSVLEKALDIIYNRFAEQEKIIEWLGKNKQEKLVAGKNITIDGNVISAGGGTAIDVSFDNKGVSYINQMKSATNVQAALKAIDQYAQTDIGNTTNLTTSSKNVVGAINEVNFVAKGGQKALYYEDYATMIQVMQSASAPALTVGQSVYIGTKNVADVYVCAVEQGPAYKYTTDKAVMDALESEKGLVTSVCRFKALEVGKIDLEDYYTKEEVDKNKQDKLVAGKNITIDGNTISAEGGGYSEVVEEVEFDKDLDTRAYHRLVTRIDDLSNEVSALIRETSGMQTDVSSLKKQCTVLSTDIAKMSDELSKIAATTIEQGKAIEALKKDLVELNAKIVTVKQELEKNISDAKDEINEKIRSVEAKIVYRETIKIV